METALVKGYKVVCPNFKSKHGNIIWKIGKTYTHDGNIEMCNSGFHFCKKAQHCFNYYEFNPENHVFEVAALGKIIDNLDKSVCDKIKIIREIEWVELLGIVNEGIGNTGYSNSGNSNSGNYNSGNCNSGDCNSGNCNSGDCNSGDWNNGNRNSGNWNSGNYNSGNCNSGDCNSGNYNSGVFCTDDNPIIDIFNKKSTMRIKEWEQHEASKIMSKLELNIWVPRQLMNDAEKNKYLSAATTDGYLKPISLKEAFANLWQNLTTKEKNIFTSLPNFDWKIFTEITGIEKI